MLYWITGLAGSGKTTIGNALYSELKPKNPATVLLDGDSLREVVGGRFGYSESERLECSMFYARLCKLLSDQGVTVICAVVAMFESVREWNRASTPGYCEVYLRVSPKVLRQRDQKGLYSSYVENQSEYVTGLSKEYEEPKNADIVIDNNGKFTPAEIVKKILELKNEN